MSQRAMMMVIGCVAMLGLLAAPAAAQSAPDVQQAREHYAKAEEAMSRGDYASAATEYGLAYEATQDPTLLLKIADANAKAGDCQAALGSYQRYLSEGNPDEALRAQTQARMEACQAAMAAGTTGADGEPTDAAAAPGTPETPDQGAGGAAPPAATPSSETTPSGADQPDQTADAEAAPPASEVFDAQGGAQGAERPPTFAEQRSSWHQSAAWLSVGLSVSFVTAGTVLAMSASSREEDLQNLINFRYPTGEPAAYAGTTRERYHELIDEGERLATASKIVFGAAGVAAISAAVLFVMDARAHPERSAGTSARVAPMAGPGSAGVTAGWSF